MPRKCYLNLLLVSSAWWRRLTMWRHSYLETAIWTKIKSMLVLESNIVLMMPNEGVKPRQSVIQIFLRYVCHAHPGEINNPRHANLSVCWVINIDARRLRNVETTPDIQIVVFACEKAGYYHISKQTMYWVSHNRLTILIKWAGGRLW